jgi:hypothetical protein
MTYSIFCLYASIQGETEPSPWLIAAEDEYAWEGDPERCEAVFKKARDDAERNGWDVREVTLNSDINAICKAFEPAEIDATVADS